jgi:hypothetical protein
MELLRGESLRERMLRGPITADEGVALVLGVLEPLAAAHASGFVHRDLKPENVFLCAEPAGKIKLLDFGIARQVTGQRVTQSGSAMGTPHYMSPEQCRSAERVTPASDVWSVGVMLYELSCGSVPFDGETLGDILVRACTEPHVPLTMRAQVSPRIAGIVDACLAKDPAQRPRDAAALIDLLRGQSPPRKPPPPATRRRRVWPWIAAAIALGAVAAAGGALAWWTNRAPLEDRIVLGSSRAPGIGRARIRSRTSALVAREAPVDDRGVLQLTMQAPPGTEVRVAGEHTILEGRWAEPLPVRLAPALAPLPLRDIAADVSFEDGVALALPIEANEGWTKPFESSIEVELGPLSARAIAAVLQRGDREIASPARDALALVRRGAIERMGVEVPLGRVARVAIATDREPTAGPSCGPYGSGFGAFSIRRETIDEEIVVFDHAARAELGRRTFIARMPPCPERAARGEIARGEPSMVEVRVWLETFVR